MSVNAVPVDVASRVLQALDPEELIDLTASLIKCNSVYDPEAGTSEEEAARLAARWAEREGFDVEVDQVAPGRPNVIVNYAAFEGERRLMFEGHTDVVTPGDVAAWKFDPFGAEIVGRRMYGRGTNDTKGNLAAMLVAMAALKRSGVKLGGRIVGGVLCDEEDRMLGVQDFIRRGRADAVTAAVICEPQDGLICVRQKGALRARFAVAGRMSHGAMPLSGLNPVAALPPILDGLWRLEQQAIAAHGRDEFLGWPSFTPTVVKAPAKGAAQLNVVASSAEVLVDIRTIPSQVHPEIIVDLKALALAAEATGRRAYADLDRRLGLERTLDLTVGVEILTDRPCTLTGRGEPVVTAAEWATRQVTGREPVLGGVLGATDGTYLWAWKNIPIVTMGAGDRYVPHQVDEWVALDDLINTAKIYALTALAYLYPQEAA
ncbi:MAG: M20/M25/M40 family metallo-hydrolase [Thermodesulfobacteriota bacterium]